MITEQPNFTVIDKMSGGSSDVRVLILEVIKEEFPEEQKEYFYQLEQKNYKKLQEIVHKIKHKISTLGLEKSYVIANNYEKNLRKESLELATDFKDILTIIENFVKKIS